MLRRPRPKRGKCLLRAGRRRQSNGRQRVRVRLRETSHSEGHVLLVVNVMGWMTGVGRPRPTPSRPVTSRPVLLELPPVFASPLEPEDLPLLCLGGAIRLVAELRRVSVPGNARGAAERESEVARGIQAIEIGR